MHASEFLPHDYVRLDFGFGTARRRAVEHPDYVRIADNPGVIVWWIESNCPVRPLQHLAYNPRQNQHYHGVADGTRFRRKTRSL